jgi:Tol biopolymer transport system component
VRVQRLVWAPDSRSFLAAMELDPGQRQLWQVPMDGAAPTLLATGDVQEYGWSPDGQMVVYTQRDASAAAVNPRRPYAVMALAPNGRTATRTLVTGLASAQLPGLTDAGAWFFSGNALWVAPYDGAPAGRIEADLTGLNVAGAPRPSPDGTRVVFACGQATCWLAPTVPAEGATGAPIRRVEGVRLAEAAWSADGRRVAVVDSNPNFVSPVKLVVLSGEGEIGLSVDIAPQEATEPPQWTPDGEAVFVQTYPRDGRRLIAVDLTTQQVLDLSQEHWDAYYALAPDGQSVLLNNGRGGFWLANILRD